MNKSILPLLFCFLAACSSTPEMVKSPQAEELPKAVPAKTQELKIYDGPAPTAIEAVPTETPDTTAKASCETPLGVIPHGGKATGYLEATVPADGICISDTLTCNDGVWSGKAIHPSCKKMR